MLLFYLSQIEIAWDPVKKSRCILIADRNPNVREFLKRELMADGYDILIAGNCSDVIRCAYKHNFIDVIILDPDLPGDSEANLIKTLNSRIPLIPVIIHAFGQGFDPESPFSGEEIFVEKQASSIEQLKKILRQMIHPL